MRSVLNHLHLYWNRRSQPTAATLLVWRVRFVRCAPDHLSKLRPACNYVPSNQDLLQCVQIRKLMHKSRIKTFKWNDAYATQPLHPSDIQLKFKSRINKLTKQCETRANMMVESIVFSNRFIAMHAIRIMSLHRCVNSWTSHAYKSLLSNRQWLSGALLPDTWKSVCKTHALHCHSIRAEHINVISFIGKYKHKSSSPILEWRNSFDHLICLELFLLEENTVSSELMHYIAL